MTQTVVYAGYKVGDTEVAVDDAGQWYIIENGDIQPYQKTMHPLAHKHGALVMQVIVTSWGLYGNLTPVQRRCLNNPETRNPRSWKVLTTRGLADDNGLTAFGHFVAIVNRDRPTREEPVPPRRGTTIINSQPVAYLHDVLTGFCEVCEKRIRRTRLFKVRVYNDDVVRANEELARVSGKWHAAGIVHVKCQPESGSV